MAFSLRLDAYKAGNCTVSVDAWYQSIDGGKLYRLYQAGGVEFTVSRLPSTITCNVSPEKAVEYENVTVTGAAPNPTNPFVASIFWNSSATLTFRKPDGTLAEKLAPLTWSGLYNYTFAPDLPGNWTVKASWTGDLNREGAASEPVSFTVKERLGVFPTYATALVSLLVVAAVVALALRRRGIRR